MGWIGSGHKNGPIDNFEVGTSIRSLHLIVRPNDVRLSTDCMYSPLSIRALCVLSLAAVSTFSSQEFASSYICVQWFCFCSVAVLDPTVGHTMDYFLHLSLSSAILIDSSTGRRAMVYIIRLLQQCYDRFVGLILNILSVECIINCVQ